MQQNDFFFAHANRVIRFAQNALAELSGKIDIDFVNVCKTIAATKGNIILMAMGKSSFVAKKFAATLASLGQPAFFVHPCEAGHGDCGNITENDTVIMLSHSGATEELCKIAPAVQRRAGHLLAIVGEAHAALTDYVDVALIIGKYKESCALTLAPTTSTTVFAVVVDAIAVCVADMSGFSEHQFGETHPYGRLGRNLTVKLADVMRPITKCAKVYAQQSIVDSLLAMAQNQMQLALVYDEEDRFLGVQTTKLLTQALVTHANPVTVSTQHYLMQPSASLDQSMLLYDAYQAVASDSAYALVHSEDPQTPVGLWLLS